MTAPPPQVLLVGRAPESAKARYETEQFTLYSVSFDSPTAPCHNPRRWLQARESIAVAHSQLEAAELPVRARPRRLESFAQQQQRAEGGAKATAAAVYIGRHRGRSEHRAEAAEHIVDSRHASV